MNSRAVRIIAKDMENQETVTTSAGTPRRKFFRLLLSEAIGIVDEVRGKPLERLSDLNTISDAKMRRIVPAFRVHCPYRVDGDRLVITQTGQEVYRFNAQEVFILSHFGKEETLDAIAHFTAEKFGQNQEIAYQQVKTLFVMLAKKWVCQ